MYICSLVLSPPLILFQNGNYVLTLAYVTLTGKRVLVQMKCPTSAALPTGLPLPPFGVSVLCSDTCMTVELPGGLLQDIQLMGELAWYTVIWVL